MRLPKALPIHGARQLPALAAVVAVGLLPAALAAVPQEGAGEEQKKEEQREEAIGLPITDEVVIRRCRSCHRPDADGNLSRLSYLRKTPEGWQASIRRMVTLDSVNLDPEEARQIVRYLADHHGLAPEEVRPGFFEAERRTIEHTYEGDEVTFNTCKACHSLGRVITQRRSEREWGLLVATHRGLYQVVDIQGFRSTRPPEDGQHPMDKAIAHLAEAFPLETPEWTAWSASMREPRLAGRWAVSGHEAGRGAVFGVMTIAAEGDSTFSTETELVYGATGERTKRSGRAIVYTGFQWRGRSSAGEQTRREVMLVERDWREMSGRWFRGDYDELGIDVTLRRISSDPVITGVAPHAVQTGGSEVELTIHGANLPESLEHSEVDFGPGVEVVGVGSSSPTQATLRVRVDPAARRGARDLFVAGVLQPSALIVYDAVSRIEVRPQAGMARVGGARMPKQLQQFEAVAFHNGPDRVPGTGDDLEIGVVEAQWSLEEYTVTYADDDLAFVGSIDTKGLFTPALDGPNPERSGRRNNVGDVWVVARYEEPGEQDRSLTARGHLLVTVPLFMRWEPWRVTD